jgi:nitrogen regulatory protein P-II 1
LCVVFNTAVPRQWRLPRRGRSAGSILFGNGLHRIPENRSCILRKGIQLMYKIEAIVRPETLEDVKYALFALGYDDFIVADAKGHCGEREQEICYRGVRYQIPFVRQLRVELSVPETALEAVIERIAGAAHTGQSGDGKIFVTSLAEVIDIGVEQPSPAESPELRARPCLAATANSSWPSAW